MPTPTFSKPSTATRAGRANMVPLRLALCHKVCTLATSASSYKGRQRQGPAVIMMHEGKTDGGTEGLSEEERQSASCHQKSCQLPKLTAAAHCGTGSVLALGALPEVRLGLASLFACFLAFLALLLPLLLGGGHRC